MPSICYRTWERRFDSDLFLAYGIRARDDELPEPWRAGSYFTSGKRCYVLRPVPSNSFSRRCRVGLSGATRKVAYAQPISRASSLREVAGRLRRAVSWGNQKV